MLQNGRFCYYNRDGRTAYPPGKGKIDMAKQTIISVGREFGSAGHEIAEKLAGELGFKFYDRNMLDEIAQEKNIDVKELEKYEEKPRNMIFSRKVNGYSNSLEEIIANMQFDFLRKKADSGESFVVVGRCAEEVLRDREGLISIFILGDQDEKLTRVKNLYHLDDAAALVKMKRHDKNRKRYHNRYSEGKWGDSRSYDLCVNSSKLGVERTMDILVKYIRRRMAEQ